jgi:hypothetical protein
MNDQKWNVVPLIDMLLENFIQRRFQGEEILLERDIVNPILPYLTQPSEFTIDFDRGEKIRDFRDFLLKKQISDFVEINLKKLLIRFSRHSIGDMDGKIEEKKKPPVLMSSDPLPEVQSFPDFASPQDVKKTEQEIMDSPSNNVRDVSEGISLSKNDVQVFQQNPLPSQVRKSSVSKDYKDYNDYNEEELLTLPLRDVLRMLRDKE